MKFEGQYHGVHDYALISVGPDDMSELGDADAPVALAWGRGIPGAVADTIIPARYNNIERLRQLFERARRGDRGDHRRARPRQRPGDHAQARLPPGDAGADRGVRDPADLRRGQDRASASPSGGAAEFFGITPDLATYAKAMGNGYPAAAFGGRREVMERAARQGQPRRHVRRQPGRGRRRGRHARDPARHRTRSRRSTPPAARIQDGLKEILDPTGIPYHFTGHPVDVRDHVPRGGRDASTATGPPPTTSCTTRSRSGCTPAARCPSRTRASRGSCARRTPTPTSSTASLTAFEDSLDAALEARAHGGAGADAARRHGVAGAPAERDGGRRWSSTATRSARSIGRRPCCWPSATARARPA